MPIHIPNTQELFSNSLQGRECMPFDEYVKWALYDTNIGYYTRENNASVRMRIPIFYFDQFKFNRMGKTLNRGLLFADQARRAIRLCFCRNRSRTRKKSLGELPHPFKATKTIRLGEPLNIPENSIVFSNEWLDAQPFKRYRFDPTTKNWNEIGVTMKEGKWTEMTLPPVSQNEDVILTFPKDLKIKYTIDWPTGAEASLNSLVKKTWQGLFITFDYGLDIERIFRDFQDGTGRSYSSHQMDNNILEQPGSKDITCHVCWNKLQENLVKHKFTTVNLQSQESFFMKYASNKIQEIIENKYTSKEEIGSLKELIHPLHLGQKFQVLHGWRK